MRSSFLARLLTSVASLSVLSLAMPGDAAPPSGVTLAKAPNAATPPAKTPEANKIDPLDWPHWRGPEQNGISRETGIVNSWDPQSGKNLLWKQPALATRSTPIIMNGKLYTLARSEPGTPKEGEKVICADAATGKVLWENKFNVYLSDVPDTRVAWSSCVGDPTTGRVYALGVCGYFVCIDGETGKTIWSHSLSEEFGLLSTYGGRTNVPVIFEDLAIINAVMTGWGDQARPTHRFLAFDKMTGELIWNNGTRPLPDDTTYSTPFLTNLKGQPMMVFGSGDGSVWSFQPRTGKSLWSFRFSLRGLNLSPLVVGETVFMGQSEENREDSTMGALGAYSAVGSGDITASNELWRKKEIMVGKSSPVILDGKIYALDDGNIAYVFDAATGAEIGKKQRLVGTITRASPLYADGKIFACTTSAWHVLQPTDAGVKITQKLRFPDGEEIHGSPVISHGRIYLPTTEAMYCIGESGAKPAAGARPELPKEAPSSEHPQPAQVQIVPNELLLKPGEKANFKVRLFNEFGQFLKESDASWTLDGPGAIDDKGSFTADGKPDHTATIITAKVGELTGAARVRVEPPLPWKFDFADGKVPVTWVGANYRHKPLEMDGEKLIVKVTTIPKGTRSQSWMGPTDLHDYAIQADVRGAAKIAKPPGGEGAAVKPEKKMPDIGLIAQRYTLDMMGESQKLQIRSWTSVLDRFSKDLPFTWKPDTWYTMKFQANVVDGKALLRGKVWPRGEPEPKEWTIEATDEAPNVNGSPGLFGNAGNAEIYYDNITVTPAAAN